MNSQSIFPTHFPHGQGKDPGAMLAQSLPGTPLAAAAAAPVLRPCKSLPEGPPVEPRAPQGPRGSGCQQKLGGSVDVSGKDTIPIYSHNVRPPSCKLVYKPQEL